MAGGSESNNQVRNIRALLSDIPEMMESIPYVGGQMIRSSIGGLYDNNIGALSTFQLGRIRLNWHLYITKKHERVVFFFFRNDVQEEVFIDLELSLSVAPVANLSPILKTDYDVRFIWFPPAFVFVAPPDHVLGSLGITMDDVKNDYALVLSLNEDESNIMSVSLHEERTSHVIHSDRGVRQEMSIDDIPLSLLFSLYRVIRSWIRGDIKSRPAIEIDTTPDNDMKEVLNTLFQLLIVSNNQLVYSAAKIDSELDDQSESIYYQLLPHYMLEEFSGKLHLRLKENGDFATQHEDKPFQLRVDLETKWGEDIPEVQVRVVPPDFLVSGTLFDLFVDELRSHSLDLADKTGISTDKLEQAIELASSHGSIFRIERGRDVDTELFILPLTPRKDGEVLMFSGLFAVQVGDTASVEYRGEFRNMILDHAKPAPEVIRYFVRLLKYMRKWGDIIR